jgi:hypothetical protein
MADDDDEGLKFEDLTMRRIIKARRRGRDAGDLWAENASPARRSRVLAFAKNDTLCQWIEDDERSICGPKAEHCDDILIEVQIKLFVAIHGAGKSVADDKFAAEQFWDELNERVGGRDPSEHWLSFYVGFVEGVRNWDFPSAVEGE